MGHTVSITAAKLDRLNPKSSPTFQSSTSKIIASWRTGLEFRRRIPFTSRESVSVSGEHPAVAGACSCRQHSKTSSARMNSACRQAAEMNRLAACAPQNFAALTERRYSDFQMKVEVEKQPGFI